MSSRDGLVLNIGRVVRTVRRRHPGSRPGSPQERNLSWLGDVLGGRSLARTDASSSSTNRRHGRRFDDISPEYRWLGCQALGDGKALALSPDERWALVARELPEPHLVLLPTGAGEPRPLAGRRHPSVPLGLVLPGRAADPDRGRREGEASALLHPGCLAGVRRSPSPRRGCRATLVSPDGREIAGTTLEGLQLIYRVDGQGRPRSIEGALPDDFLVQWSADGKSILVRGVEERPLTLYRIDLASGRRERWKELAPPDMAASSSTGPAPGRAGHAGRALLCLHLLHSDQESSR